MYPEVANKVTGAVVFQSHIPGRQNRNWASEFRLAIEEVEKKLANELEIPIQHGASSRTTETDTDHVYAMKGGVPSALLSVPMRYMHSTVEMVDLSDVERSILLLTHFVGSITSKEEFITKLG